MHSHPHISGATGDEETIRTSGDVVGTVVSVAVVMSLGRWLVSPPSKRSLVVSVAVMMLLGQWLQSPPSMRSSVVSVAVVMLLRQWLVSPWGCHLDRGYCRRPLSDHWARLPATAGCLCKLDWITASAKYLTFAFYL